MRHDWILDVLTDLRSYAQKNSLPEIAAEAEALLEVARAEIARSYRSGGEGSDGPPPGTPRH